MFLKLSFSRKIIINIYYDLKLKIEVILWIFFYISTVIIYYSSQFIAMNLTKESKDKSNDLLKWGYTLIYS